MYSRDPKEGITAARNRAPSAFAIKRLLLLASQFLRDQMLLTKLPSLDHPVSGAPS